MTDKNHTPGPWRVSGPYHDGISVGAPDADFTVYVRSGTSEQEDADAHLIAAAPDLLAACELVWGDHHSDMSVTSWNALRDAIAKARGDK